ncbi:hypothetical protein [Acidianus sp. HS-5]|uniref:hypothetical protein n=1 Tax=Acidianus sp. HS-5 TaxID=2886040 RepID=UPI001F1EEA1E|nr:hypothetical protein [Acidianus sp. HS-5]
MKFEIFSKARYLILLNENGEILEKRNNPALNSPMKRPVVAKECVELKANEVIAPHGSLCFPSYRILKKAGVKMLIANPRDDIRTRNLREVNMREVLYSSFLAVTERIRE